MLSCNGSFSPKFFSFLMPWLAGLSLLRYGCGEILFADVSPLFRLFLSSWFSCSVSLGCFSDGLSCHAFVLLVFVPQFTSSLVPLLVRCRFSDVLCRLYFKLNISLQCHRCLKASTCPIPDVHHTPTLNGYRTPECVWTRLDFGCAVCMHFFASTLIPWVFRNAHALKFAICSIHCWNVLPEHIFIHSCMLHLRLTIFSIHTAL